MCVLHIHVHLYKLYMYIIIQLCPLEISYQIMEEKPKTKCLNLTNVFLMFFPNFIHSPIPMLASDMSLNSPRMLQH